MTLISLQEFLEDLNKIQKYTFDKDLYEGTDNLGLMEVETDRALIFIKKHPEIPTRFRLYESHYNWQVIHIHYLQLRGIKPDCLLD